MRSFDRRYRALLAGVAFISCFGMVAARREQEFAPPMLGQWQGRLVPSQPPRLVTPEVTTVLSTTTAGNVAQVGTQGGYLAIVAPVSLAGTAVPRGRIYAEAYVQDAMGNRILCAWRGYPSCAASTKANPAGPASAPGWQMDPSWTIVVVATQTDQGAGTRIGFQCVLTEEQPSGSAIINEPVASGRGELVSSVPANPAAGAEVTVTVPATSSWAFKAATFRLTTSATVINRFAALQAKNVGAANAWLVRTQNAQTASRAEDYTWAPGLPDTAEPGVGTTRSVPSPTTDIIFGAGATISTVTDQIQGADQWSSMKLTVETWAVPA